MTGSVADVFADALAGLTARLPELDALTQRLTAPVTVAVAGRAGAGIATVSAALRCAGWQVTGDVGDADLAVWVLTETATPEDRGALDGFRGIGTPAVPVLNKADLFGPTPAGPLPEARRCCADLGPVIGTPPEPMVALLAVAALDPGGLAAADLAALRLLCAAPADLSGPDAFLAGPHRLTSGQRHRLLDRLDVFGIAHAVVALRRAPGAGLPQLRALLRGLSGVDDVCARLTAAAAPLRYRRMRAALTELAVLALTEADIAAWLTSDHTVLAQMTLAVAVVQDAGMTVDPADDAAAHLRRAVQWKHYAAGPVNSLQRCCGSDIVRGSLRLWAKQRRCP